MSDQSLTGRQIQEAAEHAVRAWLANSYLHIQVEVLATAVGRVSCFQLHLLPVVVCMAAAQLRLGSKDMLHAHGAASENQMQHL